ncbi:hypothetical protein F5887DRAFT_979205 [Amanita rubescens]|nr:hypothetical protein F5887DRAFT_979205 [Amanita rubescens]
MSHLMEKVGLARVIYLVVQIEKNFLDDWHEGKNRGWLSAGAESRFRCGCSDQDGRSLTVSSSRTVCMTMDQDVHTRIGYRIGIPGRTGHVFFRTQLHKPIVYEIYASRGSGNQCFLSSLYTSIAMVRYRRGCSRSSNIVEKKILEALRMLSPNLIRRRSCFPSFRKVRKKVASPTENCPHANQVISGTTNVCRGTLVGRYMLRKNSTRSYFVEHCC